jgi:hypothetical protein
MHPVQAYSARAPPGSSERFPVVTRNASLIFPQVLVVSFCVASDTGQANRHILGQYAQ